MGRKKAVVGKKQAALPSKIEDFEDEIDEFHKQRNKINLDSDDDAFGSEDDSDVEAVFNIKGADDSSDEEDDADEDDDEDNLTGYAAKLKQQAKFMRRKLGGAQEEDEDDEDDEDGDEEKVPWGKNKRAYYSADNVDYEIQSDDEEMPVEEEMEVMRMQKKMASRLKPEDYEQEEDEEEDMGEDEDEEEETMADKLAGSNVKKQSQKVHSDVLVEEVVKDMNALSKEQQMEVVMSDAPELVGLLSELKQSLDEVKNKVQPLVEQVKCEEYLTADGLSYLEAKHLLLLTYCNSIVFYLLLKAEGRSVRDHPVINRMVELRLYLEKIRPIDKKLQYQIDKLLKIASSLEKQDNKAVANGELPSGMSQEQALTFRPNPDLLVSKLDESTQEGNGLYRPPMIAPTAMEEGTESKKGARNRQRGEVEARRKASRSSFVRELAAELEGRPEEVESGAGIGMETKEMQRERERLLRRAEEEERLFARVPMKKEEKKRLRALNKQSNTLSGLLDDFEDDILDIVKTEDAPAVAGAPPDNLLKRRKLTQIIAEAGKPVKKVKMASGDADVPSRGDLGERRRALENQQMNRRRKEIQFEDGEGEGDEDNNGAEGGAMSDGDEGEDELYREVKEKRNEKLAMKAAKYSRGEGNVPRKDAVVEGKRTINRDIEKNRGLTPHRNKLVRNPRKKYKVAHAKAVIRRKGQVRDVKTEVTPYAGQATGIKSNLTRSTKLA